MKLLIWALSPDPFWLAILTKKPVALAKLMADVAVPEMSVPPKLALAQLLMPYRAVIWDERELLEAIMTWNGAVQVETPLTLFETPRLI